MQLQLYRRYRNRAGETVIISRQMPNNGFPWQDTEGRCYTDAGSWYGDGTQNALDLTEEVDGDEVNASGTLVAEPAKHYLIPGADGPALAMQAASLAHERGAIGAKQAIGSGEKIPLAIGAEYLSRDGRRVHLQKNLHADDEITARRFPYQAVVDEGLSWMIGPDGKAGRHDDDLVALVISDDTGRALQMPLPPPQEASGNMAIDWAGLARNQQATLGVANRMLHAAYEALRTQLAPEAAEELRRQIADVGVLVEKQAGEFPEKPRATAYPEHTGAPAERGFGLD